MASEAQREGGPGGAGEIDDLIGRLADERAAASPPARLTALAGRVAEDLLELLFPSLSIRDHADRRHVQAEYLALMSDLVDALRSVGCGTGADEHAERFARELPRVRELLLTDAEAIFAGDPAAHSVDEVVLAYPGFKAIAVQRFAHVLHGFDVPILPRLLTECAHQKTGIDIHPGARIGPSFAIDHGTGIVVGETADIGAHVRLYQGVTLGATNVHRGLQRKKRHPTIEDDVVIYANATILGGDTVVGRGSVIGANVWLTRSAPPFSVVMPTARVEQRSGEQEDDLMEFNI